MLQLKRSTFAQALALAVTAGAIATPAGAATLRVQPGPASVFAGGAEARIVPAPPPTKTQLAQAASDRRDPFTRPRSPLPAVASLPTGAWQALGPAPLGTSVLVGQPFGAPNSGRVTGIATIPSGTHAGRVVVATAGGGIWTSDDNGATWTPRTDQAATLATGSIADDPSSPDHLIAGTGEANKSADSAWGTGVLSSTDGGTTWTLQNPGGVFTGDEIGQVAIDPSSSSHMFAATTTGLYVTSNGGASWAKPVSSTYTPFDGDITAVVIDPSTPSIVYIAGSNSKFGSAVNVAKSTDGGLTWAAANGGLPASTSGAYANIALAIAPSSPSVLYVSLGSFGPGAMYKTTTGGSSWSQLTVPDFTGSGYSYGGSGGPWQGWYDNVLAVDPTNAGHVLAGGIALVESTDGGQSWVNTNGGDFSTDFNDHPDHHALAFRPDGKVWVGDDGGVYLYTPGDAGSPPAAGTFADTNGNLNTIQFYFGFNEVGGTLLAGTQDNASAVTSSPSLSGWTEIGGEDGAASAITPNDPSVQFIQENTRLQVTTDAFTGTINDISPLFAGGSIFSPPMTVIPNSATPSQPTVLYGADGVWRTTDPTDPSPSWAQATTGTGGKVTSFAVSPSNPQVAYAGYTNGTIQVSTDGGASWAALAAQPFSDTWITGISVDPANPDAVTASVSIWDTRPLPSPPHVAQYTWSSTPSSGSWTVISGNLPANAAVSRVVYDEGALIAATDLGVYGTSAANGSSTVWGPVASGFPNVQVQDLFVDPATGALYAITHGRGAWVLTTSVTRVSPAAGPLAGGNAVTITGVNLAHASAVHFGTSSAPIVSDSATQIIATAPARSAGTVDVSVTTPDGRSQASSGDRYTYDRAPTITGVNPRAGSTAGGNTVTIAGTGFVRGAHVFFGSSASATVTFVSPAKLTAVAPAHAAGTVRVSVWTAGGPSAATNSDLYAYGAPTITAVSPRGGPTAGGNTVTVFGTGFVPGAIVRFGSTASAKVTFVSTTRVTAVAPAAAARTVRVSVATPAGMSPSTNADLYAYGAPTVTGLSPHSGSTAGRNTVTITGTGFVPGATVRFGSTLSSTVTFVSPAKVTAVAPAHAAGAVHVGVTTPGGASASTSADLYTYT